MAKYIKCDNCGNRIYFGDELYKFGGYAGLFCSAECFSDAYGEVQELDYELANDCYHTVYDDEEEVSIKQEILKVKAEITIMEERLKDLQFALELCEKPLTTQN